MICPSCGSEVPDYASLCEYCGALLEPKSKPPDPEPPRPETAKAQKKQTSKKAIAFLAIMVLLLFCVVYYFHDQFDAANKELAAANKELATVNEELATTKEEFATANKELAAVNEELATTNEELAIANKELAAVNEELATTKEELAIADGKIAQVADLYRLNEECRFASSHFYAEKGVVLLKADGSKTTVPIHYDYSGSMALKHKSGDSAECRWAETPREGTETFVTIRPKAYGASSFLFTNDQNDESFQIVVLVID